MPDVGFVLYYITPRVFLLAMCMELLNMILMSIGDKKITEVLFRVKGNEKEQAAIVRVMVKLGWRYLPVFLFTLAGVLREAFGFDVMIMRFVHLFLVAWALMNCWSIFGLNMNFLGGTLNMLVCAVNKGLMPTLYPGDPTGLHSLMNEATRLPFLCDWIIVGYWQLSPGDILIVLGTLLFLIYQNYIFFRSIWSRKNKPVSL